MNTAASSATTLLLVEDNPADARVVKECLRDAGATGIRLEEVASLSAALHRIALGGVDAVLHSVALGAAGAVDTVQLIRAAARDQPIIVLSSAEDRERALHAVASGAHDYLVKGRFDGAALVRMVQHALQRKHAERALNASNARLAESAERFRLLGEVTFDGIAIIRDGKVMEANAGLAHLIGAGEDRIIGREWTDFVRSDLRAEVHERLRGEAEGRFELHLLRTDGQALPVEATSRRHIMNGDAVQIMAIRDLSEKRVVEDRLREVEKMEAVGQLAGGVAHDFNNILAAILMTAELVLAGPGLTEQLQDDIRTIHSAAKRGADITRQLLTFSRKQVTTPVAVDVTSLLEEMQPMLAQLVRANTSIEAHSDAVRGVEADPVQLEQVILNLVVNARDAMPRGGTVRVETRDVHIEESTEDLPLKPGAHVMIAVSDTGTGIEDSVRRRLFEPFFTTKPAGKGTGLGLSTVANIVRSLGGAIRVRSTLGVGSTFEVYFPALPSRGIGRAHATAGALPRGCETILVVEDESVVRASICRLLRSLGYDVIEAKNGRDGLLLRRRRLTSVALIVTDVVMPEMTGPEMASELWRTDPKLPVVFLSGYADSMLDPQTLPANAALLSKPFTSGLLAAKVREQIDRSRGTDQHHLELRHGDLAAAVGLIA